MTELNEMDMTLTIGGGAAAGALADGGAATVAAGVANITGETGNGGVGATIIGAAQIAVGTVQFYLGWLLE